MKIIFEYLLLEQFQAILKFSLHFKNKTYIPISSPSLNPQNSTTPLYTSRFIPASRSQDISIKIRFALLTDHLPTDFSRRRRGRRKRCR